MVFDTDQRAGRLIRLFSSDCLADRAEDVEIEFIEVIVGWDDSLIMVSRAAGST